MKVLVKDRFDDNLMAVEICMVDAREQIDCEEEYYNVGSCVRLEDNAGDEIWVVTRNMVIANAIVEELFSNGKADLTKYFEHTFIYPTIEEDDEALRKEVIDQ